MEIELKTPISIIKVEEQSAQVNTIVIESVNYTDKKAECLISFKDGTGITKLLTLWEDVTEIDEEGNIINQTLEYTDIGQFTDTDVLNRVKQLIIK